MAREQKLKLELVVDDKGSVKVDKFGQQVEQTTTKAGKSADKLSSRLGGIGSIAKKAGLAFVGALAGAGVALMAIVKTTADTGDNFQKMAGRIGVSVEALSSLAYAAELSGADIATVETGLRLLSKRLYDADTGLKEAERSFQELGISTTDSSGKLRAADQVLLEIADKLAGMEDQTKATAIAQELFGRSGTALLPMLKQGSAAIREQQAAAVKMGNTWDKLSADQAADFNDALLDITWSVTGAKNQIGMGLIPILTELAPKVSNVTTEFAAWLMVMRQSGEMAKALKPAIDGVAFSLNILVTSLKWMAKNWELTKAVFNFLILRQYGGAVINVIKALEKYGQVSNRITVKLSAADKEKIKGVKAVAKANAKAAAAIVGDTDAVKKAREDALKETEKKHKAFLAAVAKEHAQTLAGMQQAEDQYWETVAGAYTDYLDTSKQITAEVYQHRAFKISEHAGLLRAAGVAETDIQAHMKEKYVELEQQKLMGSNSFFAGVRSGWLGLQQSQETWADHGKNVFNSFVSSSRLLWSDVFFDVVKGDIKDLEVVWDDFLDSMLRSFVDVLAQMVTEWTIMQGLTFANNNLGTSFAIPGMTGSGGNGASSLAVGYGAYSLLSGGMGAASTLPAVELAAYGGSAAMMNAGTPALAGLAETSLLATLAASPWTWAALGGLTLLGGGNPLAGVGTAIEGASNIISGALETVGEIFSFDTGTPYVPRDMIAGIHQGERILTATENRDLVAAMNRMSGGGSAGAGVVIHNVNLQIKSSLDLRNPHEAREVARVIKRELRAINGLYQ